MSLLHPYLPRGAVDREGFDDGYCRRARYFDIGFDPSYDAAFAAGRVLAMRERPEADDGRELKPGNGDLR